MARARALATSERRSDVWEAPIPSPRMRVREVLGRRVEEIRAAYEAGATCQGLALEYGVPESTMRGFFRREGIVIRPNGKIAAADVTEMARLRDEGWTYREIGERFKVTRHAVAMRLRRGACLDTMPSRCSANCPPEGGECELHPAVQD